MSNEPKEEEEEKEEGPSTPQSWVDKVLMPISQRPSAHLKGSNQRAVPGKVDFAKLSKNRGPEPKKREKKGAEMVFDLLKPQR